MRKSGLDRAHKGTRAQRPLENQQLSALPSSSDTREAPVRLRSTEHHDRKLRLRFLPVKDLAETRAAVRLVQRLRGDQDDAGAGLRLPRQR